MTVTKAGTIKAVTTAVTGLVTALAAVNWSQVAHTAGRLYPWVWVIFVGWFALWEGFALGTGHSEWTLSDYVWRLEKLGHGWSFFRYLVAALCLWLFFHFTFGWLR